MGRINLVPLLADFTWLCLVLATVDKGACSFPPVCVASGCCLCLRACDVPWPGHLGPLAQEPLEKLRAFSIIC